MKQQRDDILELMSAEELLLFEQCIHMLFKLDRHGSEIAKLERAREKLRPLIDPINFLLSDDNDEEIIQ